MPTFRFHVYASNGAIALKSEQEFANLEEAMEEAKASARDIVFQSMQSGQAVREPCIEITDSTGFVVAALSVSEVLDHPFHPRFEGHYPGKERQNTTEGTSDVQSHTV